MQLGLGKTPGYPLIFFQWGHDGDGFGLTMKLLICCEVFWVCKVVNRTGASEEGCALVYAAVYANIFFPPSHLV